MTAAPTLAAALTDEGRGRLTDLIQEVRHDPAAARRRFPAAARLVGRGPTDPSDPLGVTTPLVEDLVRGALLEALAAARDGAADRILQDVEALYRDGDADEKRAVLRALPALPVGAGALPLLRDALRTNDTRLVAAAMGAYATAHLDDDAWRQGVLKCLFVGVPVAAVDGLDRRADAELVRMVTAYAEERRAAGREVPADATRILTDHAPTP
ncbi:EboA domain-containing protein [Georgenia thermotolerans]|uniref:Sugar phosphate isomerase n=1 Tax=Georgenia thermotolerans TaxID=527326 RepID=A0A7J5UNC3_9MICO|nr:EboA domain-containing protein [Georgenia thermotolerans]KAE8763770.1 hypothetical protein GB883_12365 [Georgenia thermotolerans]